MTRSPIAAAILALSAAAGAATNAAASPRIPISATYQPAAKLYCVRPATRDEAASVGVGFRDRACFSNRKWRLRGVMFKRPARAVALARL